MPIETRATRQGTTPRGRIAYPQRSRKVMSSVDLMQDLQHLHNV